MFDIYTLEVITWALMEYRETLWHDFQIKLCDETLEKVRAEWFDFRIKLCDETLEKVRAEIKRIKKEGKAE